MTIRFSVETNIGKKREVNEDSLWPPQSPHPNEDNPYGQLFIVADGMGGHGAGDLASRLAIEEISENFYSLGPEYGEIPARLKLSIQKAHLRLKQEASQSSSLERMGTTLVMAVVQFDEAQQQGRLWIGWVGDSRAYRMRDGKLKQLSEDHSKLWPQIKAGQLSWDEVRFHSERSKVTNSLAVKRAKVEPDIKPFDLLPGDQILLCSDGVTGEVRPHDLEETLKYHEPTQATQRLIDLANADKVVQREGQAVKIPGGDDNITAVIIEIPGGQPRPLPPVKPKPATKPETVSSSKLAVGGMVIAAIVGLMLLIAIGGVAFWAFSRNSEPPTPIAQSDPPTPTATVPAVIEVGDETAAPTATQTETPTPTPTLAPGETREPTSTRRPTNTPTSTATPTPTFLPTATGIPTATETVITVSSNSIELLQPSDKKTVDVNTITFVWRWRGELLENQGFEVRVGRNADELLGVHNAVESNNPNCNVQQNPCVKMLEDSSYQLSVDISTVPSVSGNGLYFWTVYLVEIAPEYRVLDDSFADVSQFDYVAPGSVTGGKSGGGETGSGGDVNDDGR